jgi:hypothetical protein
MKDHPFDVKNYMALDSSSLQASKIGSLPSWEHCNRVQNGSHYAPLEKNSKKKVFEQPFSNTTWFLVIQIAQ